MWCGNRVLKEFSTDVYSVTHAKDACMADNVEISSDFSQQNIREALKNGEDLFVGVGLTWVMPRGLAA